jgi:hypothetical protein
MKKLGVFIISLFLMSLISVQSIAQCAMCRATLETNVSNGSETELAATLNIGILYLFAAPYIIIAGVGIFWFRRSRKVKNQS